MSYIVKYPYMVFYVFLTSNLFFVSNANAQGTPTFSIDFQGPTLGATDGFGVGGIREGDILTVSTPALPGPNPPVLGPIASPGIMVSAPTGGVGIFPGGLGLLPTPLGLIEIDAISFGKDIGDKLHFSVDEFSLGVAGTVPDVASEGAGGNSEASANVFMYLGAVVPTNIGAPVGNITIIDGNGLAPSGAQGLGLIEPNIPNFGVIPDPGDNLDALDIDTLTIDFAGRIYFSLDSTFIDPFEPGVAPPLTANSGSALINGFSGADILVSSVGGTPGLAIPATALGLDLGGIGTDDIDGLSFDDADASGSLTPGDVILFSVRRGSMIIGVADSLFGEPIEEGDILTSPTTPGLPPAIFIAAERLGLSTIRSGSGTSDDLDALDLSFVGLSDLSIIKTAPATAIPGSPISYNLIASNAGPSAVIAAQVFDTFSAGLTACTWTCLGLSGGTCPATGSGNIAASVNLPVGGSTNFTVNCDVDSSAVGTLTNSAMVSAPALIFDPSIINNNSSVTSVLTPTVDLSITKTDNEVNVSPPTSLTYTIVVGNSGPSDVIDASVDDSFPAEVNNISWSCTGSMGSTCASSGTGDIHELVSIPVGGSVTFSASVDSNGVAGDVVTNMATVTAPVGYSDSALGNNSATDITNYIDLIFKNGFE